MIQRISQTLWPSALMRRGWSRVPRSVAPNGEATNIAISQIDSR